MIDFIMGIIFGVTMTMIILDDYSQRKLRDYIEELREKEAQHYIKEAEKITEGK